MSNPQDPQQPILEALSRIEAVLHALLYAITHDEDDETSGPAFTLDGDAAGGERQQDLPL